MNHSACRPPLHPPPPPPWSWTQETRWVIDTGLLIFHGKKSKISRDFQVQIHGKIGRFHGIFAGKKSKFVEKSADFAGFSRRKSQNSQKNRPISRYFSGKKSNYEGFSGANSKKNRPISREILGGNFAKKQSVKNSRFH